MTKDQIMELVDEYATLTADIPATTKARAAVVAALGELEELNAQLREQNNAVDAACAYLEAQVDALTKDAARYQWLRTCKHDSLVLIGDTQFCELMMEEVLDNAIDAAIAAQKEQV